MIVLLLACRSPEPTPTPAPTPAHTADTAGVSTADTAPPEPTPFVPVQLDCPTLPPLPDSFTLLPNLGPHEDFGFDADGQMVGVRNGNLIRQTRDGEVTLISPNVGDVRGTRVLPDGRMAVAHLPSNSIGLVAPDGARQLLASSPGPNGIAVDLAGNVWTATTSGTIQRIDPSGQSEFVVELTGTLDGIAFAPDYRRLYFNTEFGDIWSLEIDENGEPVGGHSPFAQVPAGFTLLDGMTTDVCGNLYVVRMDGRIYRFLPDGTPDGFVSVGNTPAAQFIPAANFGSGLGGFARDKLYVMSFLGGVFEGDIGIEGRWEPHYPVPVELR